MKKEYVCATRHITVFLALSLCVLLVQPSTLYAGVGAIPGKFSVTSYGAASYSLPIELPPGVGGMTPKLSLVYSSRSRNGLLGVGWSVNGLSSIGRCVSTIAQDGETRGIKLDSSDRYCLGKSRLVAVSGSYGVAGTEYRTEKESFSKIIQSGGDCGGPCGFTVFTKDRRILEYGVTQNSQDVVPGSTAVLRWSVNKISDRSGNSIVFNYEKDDTSDAQRISSITYAGNASQLPAVDVLFLYEARPDVRTRFVIGGRKTVGKRLKTIAVRHAASGSNISEYRMTYSLSAANTSSQLLTVTRCGFDASGGEDCLNPTVFSWPRSVPEYVGWTASPTSSIPPLPGSITGGINVVGVTECQLFAQGDVNGDGLTDLICVFGATLNGQAISNTDVQLSTGDKYGSWVTYQDVNASGFNFINIDGCKPLSIGDVNGDGMTDIVCPHTDGRTYVQLSEENQYTDWKEWSASTPPNGISSCNLTRADDVNGDKRTDLVCLQGNSTYVQVATDSGFTDWAQWNAGAFPNDMGKCRYLSTGDVDGDNLADIICALDTDNSGNSAQLTYVQRSLADRFNDWEILYTSPGKSGFKLKNCNALLKSDVNGDNLQDILCAMGSDVLVQVSTGLAYLPWQSWGVDNTLDTRNCAQLLSSDVDGDGMADPVCPNKSGGSTSTFVKRSAGTSYSGWQTFSQSQSIDLANCARVFPVDANGDGLIDLACAFRLPNLQNVTYVQNLVKVERRVGIPERPLPMNRNVSKPDMIEQFRDGYGNAVVVDYAALTDPVVYSTNGDCSWNPDLSNPGFVGPLPNPTPPTSTSGPGYPNRCINAPLYVVASVRSTDGVGGLSTATYRYEDAGMNSLGRGFLGFEKINAENMQNGIVSTTRYDQSLARDPYSNSAFAKTGLPIRVQKRLADGTLISDTANSWQSITQITNGVYDVYLSQTRVTSRELDGSFKRIVNTTNYQRDEYGNFGFVAEDIVSFDFGAYSQYVNKIENTYSNDPIQWLIGLPTRSTVTNTMPSGISASRTSAFEYDSQTGQLIAEVTEPDNPELKLRTDYQYDTYGNRTSRTVTDSGSARYPILMRRERDFYNYAGLALDNTYTIVSANAVSHYEVTVVDARYGTTKQKTGPNGLTTVWEYDAFGRQLLQRNPDGTETRWDRSWCDSSCPAYAVRSTTQTSTGEPAVTTYYDSLGREIRTETIGFNGRVIAKDTEYDGLGRVARESRNYFVGDTVYWTLYTYDDLDRVIASQSPDGGNTEITYTGLTTVVRKYDNAGTYSQSTTRSVNGRGEEVQVIDANNQILTKSYDAFGNLIETVDGEGNRTVMEYDALGRKVAMVDPDMGRWEYAYDAVGQQRFQKDAKNQVVTTNYDRIGRMILRDEPEGRTTWLYDQGSMAKGKLVQVDVDTSRYQQKLTYDNFGRVATESRLVNGVLLEMALAYDSAGRIAMRSYPNDFSVTYRYNIDGYLAQVVNSADAAEVFWKADDSDADGNVTLFTLGNGQQTVRLYEPFSGRLTQVSTGIGGNSEAQYMTYTYDALGNLTERVDADQNLTETFQYDGLNRLVASDIVGIGTKNYAYDNKGNITAKGVVNDYRYGENGAGIHAVSYAGGQTYIYDANGNMTKAGGRTQIWSSYNKPTAIYEVGDSWKVTAFSYGPDRTRYFRYDLANKQFTSTLYFGGYYEEVTNASSYKQYKYYIYVNNQVVAQHERYVNTGTGVTSSWTKYLHYDNLGSVNAVTYGNRNSTFVFILETMSFDAFGARRIPRTWADADPGVLLRGWATTRGFTGHEQIDNFGLVHMNGRVYDPALGRFLSADPFVQDTGNLQALNRYSYVLNNPLAYTDPSGFFGDPTFGGFFDNIGIDDDFNFVFDDTGFNFGDFGSTTNGADLFTFNDSNFLDPFLFENDGFYDDSVGLQPFARGNTIESQSDDGFASVLDGVQTTLDVIGAADIAVPILAPVAIVADLSSGLISLIRGDNFGAAASFSAALPFALGAAGTIAKFSNRALDVVPSVTRGGIQANRAAGKAAENITEAGLRRADDFAGRQVTIETSTGQRTVIDFVTRQRGVVETKLNSARLSPGQRQLFDDIQNGRQVTPRGQNAFDAGLTPGERTTLTGCRIDRICQ